MVFGDFLVGKQSETCPKIASEISIWHIVFSAMQIIINVTKVSQYPRATVFLNAKSHNHWSGCLHRLAVIPRSRCFLHSFICPKKWMCRLPIAFHFCVIVPQCVRTVTLDPEGLVSMGAAEGEMIVFVTQSHCAPRARWPETKVFACVFACMCTCVCEKEDNALDRPWNYSHGWGLLTFHTSPSVWLIKCVLPAFFLSYTYKNGYSIPYLWICSM